MESRPNLAVKAPDYNCIGLSLLLVSKWTPTLLIKMLPYIYDGHHAIGRVTMLLAGSPLAEIYLQSQFDMDVVPNF